MKVYMIQAFPKALYYKVAHERIVNVQPLFTIPRVFFTKKQAYEFINKEFPHKDCLYTSPIIIGVEVEPIDE